MTARDDVTLPRARRPAGGSHRGGRRPEAAPPAPAVARRSATTRAAPTRSGASRAAPPRPGRSRAATTRATPLRPTPRTAPRRRAEPVRSPRRPRGGRRVARRPHLPIWQELSLLVVVALVLAVVVKTFFAQAFYIPSGSMEPTFLVQDRVLVQKVSYWFGDVQRGDVIVFDDPGGWLGASEDTEATGIVPSALELVGLYPTGGHLIKRVVGVGGDRVSCCGEDGKLRVNGVPLDEPYLADQVSTRDQTFDVTVPEGYLWVMGDNRGNSADSRAHMGDPGGGFLPREDVTGKAWVTVWPWGRAGGVGDPGTTFDQTALDRAREEAGS